MESTADIKALDQTLTKNLLSFFMELHNPKPNKRRILYYQKQISNLQTKYETKCEVILKKYPEFTEAIQICHTFIQDIKIDSVFNIEKQNRLAKYRKYTTK
jgi:hypothetical protein